ncbi:hypothetical protein JTB14_000504 [Gonioctena quinquepunctata]|nr:hypothetical protein JTB14_000504 [Gonioctena quinquepunctata]
MEPILASVAKQFGKRLKDESFKRAIGKEKEEVSKNYPELKQLRDGIGGSKNDFLKPNKRSSIEKSRLTSPQKSRQRIASLP